MDTEDEPAPRSEATRDKPPVIRGTSAFGEKSPEQDTDDPDLQCSICLDFFYEPLTLQCGHSFCRVCLLQSTKLAPDGRSCPQCRATITSITSPVDHPADANIAAKIAATVSPERLEERKEQSKVALEALAEHNAGAMPVFIMRGARDSFPGAPVELFFFEPRYRVLIRRAWEGERRFLWADSAPRASQPLSALLVSVESARFLPDGRANVAGRALERVSFDHSWVEEGTSGLWYAGSEAPDPSVRVAATPSTTIVLAASSVRESGTVTTLPSATVVRSLETAISRGAPTYNSGDVRGCAELYLATARTLLSEESLSEEVDDDFVRNELRQATARAQELLADGGRRKADNAAWVLRHAFDRILGAQHQPSAALRARSTPSSTAEAQPSGAAAELPVFYYSGLSVCIGARAPFSLFEPRYLLMADECWKGGRLLLCASVRRGGSPSSGQPAVLARMDSCTADGPRLQVVLVGVSSVRLGAVREDVEKAGLWYAQTVHAGGSGSSAAVAGGGSGCCTIC